MLTSKKIILYMNIFGFHFPFFIKKKIRSFDSEFTVKLSNEINILMNSKHLVHH